MRREIEVTIDQLFFCEQAMRSAIARCATIQGNYMVDRNLELIDQALKPVRRMMFEEPMRWHFHSQVQGAVRPARKDGDEETKAPTKEQVEAGRKAFEECLTEKVTFCPYRVAADKIGDGLKRLSDKRENLTDEQLAELNEDFYLALRNLRVLKDEDGE